MKACRLLRRSDSTLANLTPSMNSPLRHRPTRFWHLVEVPRVPDAHSGPSMEQQRNRLLFRRQKHLLEKLGHRGSSYASCGGLAKPKTKSGVVSRDDGQVAKSQRHGRGFKSNDLPSDVPCKRFVSMEHPRPPLPEVWAPLLKASVESM